MLRSALILFLGTAFAWKGQFSSTTESSTTRTFNPLEANKKALRKSIVKDINHWRQEKFDRLNEVLKREQFFRDFSGQMYGLTLDEETQQSNLWAIEKFAHLRAVGGGLGAFYGANSLVWHRRKGELLTLAYQTPGDGVNGPSDLAVVEVNPLTGFGKVKCRVNESFIPWEQNQILDLAHDDEGLLAWIREEGIVERNHSVFVIEDDNGVDFDDAGDGWCNAYEKELTNPLFNTTMQETRPHFRSEKPLLNAALAVSGRSFQGVVNTYAFSYDRRVNTLDTEIVDLPVDVLAEGTDHVRFHAGAYDPEFKSVWVVLETREFNALCGFVELDIKTAAAAGGSGIAKPSACFELPAIAGFAIKPSATVW